MASENLKSTIVTGADATPVDLNNSLINHGRLREQVAKIEAAGGDAGSTYRLFRVWSGWRISEIDIACDDLSGAGAVLDIGVYQTAENGGAAVDDDFFATDVDVATAALARTRVMYEATAANIDKIEKPLWELLGQTEDPKRWYDIVATSGTAAITGTLAGWLRYVDGT
jgi:hypothetical protein